VNDLEEVLISGIGDQELEGMEGRPAAADYCAASCHGAAATERIGRPTFRERGLPYGYLRGKHPWTSAAPYVSANGCGHWPLSRWWCLLLTL